MRPSLPLFLLVPHGADSSPMSETLTLTFPLGLRPDITIKAARVPVVGEFVVLGEERWAVGLVEWHTGANQFATRPVLHMRPSWGLREALRELDGHR